MHMYVIKLDSNRLFDGNLFKVTVKLHKLETREGGSKFALKT